MVRASRRRGGTRNSSLSSSQKEDVSSSAGESGKTNRKKNAIKTPAKSPSKVLSSTTLPESSPVPTSNAALGEEPSKRVSAHPSASNKKRRVLETKKNAEGEKGAEQGSPGVEIVRSRRNRESSGKADELAAASAVATDAEGSSSASSTVTVENSAATASLAGSPSPPKKRLRRTKEGGGTKKRDAEMGTGEKTSPGNETREATEPVTSNADVATTKGTSGGLRSRRSRKNAEVEAQPKNIKSVAEKVGSANETSKRRGNDGSGMASTDTNSPRKKVTVPSRKPLRQQGRRQSPRVRHKREDSASPSSSQTAQEKATPGGATETIGAVATESVASPRTATRAKKKDEKEKGGGEADGASTPRPKVSSSHDGMTGESARSPPPAPRRSEILDRALEQLQKAMDLPTSYAALKAVKDDLGDERARDAVLSDEERQLVQDASLAVPYMMYKLAFDRFTQPPSQGGGLAFSVSKAGDIAKELFTKMGTSCCSSGVTESDLERHCCHKILSEVDARKVVPHLRRIGYEARSKVARGSSQH